MLIYIALLAVILTGSVFSSYSIMFSEQHQQDKVESLNQDL